MQLKSRKDVLEIELNENLVRRRDDLRLKIERAEQAREGLAQEDQEDAAIGEDLEQKKRELQKLDQSITEIGKRLEGKSNSFPYPFSLLSMSSLLISSRDRVLYI